MQDTCGKRLAPCKIQQLHLTKVCLHFTQFNAVSMCYRLALSCSGEYMVARISKAYLRLLGYHEWSLYLNSSDSFCTPQITQYYVVFNIPFSGCGTIRQVRKRALKTKSTFCHYLCKLCKLTVLKMGKVFYLLVQQTLTLWEPLGNPHCFFSTLP